MRQYQKNFKIFVCAIVYGCLSSKYNLMGDLCFCNGMLVYNIGDTKIQSLESWIKTYKGFAWGNGGGVY